MDIEFIEKKEVATKTYSFIFSGKVDYEAGQHGVLKIGEDKRVFSFSSSPSEDFLMFTTRITGSEFKEKLLELKKGDKVDLNGPYGIFTLKEKKDVIMVAGGIGITPLYSMIKYATDKRIKTKIILFYFNRTEKDSAFLHELEVLEAKNKNFKFIPVMTKQETWQGEKGFLTADLIDKYIEVNKNTLFYIVGPPKTVSIMSSTLMNANIPVEKIVTENFSGY